MEQTTVTSESDIVVVNSGEDIFRSFFIDWPFSWLGLKKSSKINATNIIELKITISRIDIKCCLLKIYFKSWEKYHMF